MDFTYVNIVLEYKMQMFKYPSNYTLEFLIEAGSINHSGDRVRISSNQDRLIQRGGAGRLDSMRQ